jgi:hypothetical protein
MSSRAASLRRPAPTAEPRAVRPPIEPAGRRVRIVLGGAAVVALLAGAVIWALGASRGDREPARPDPARTVALGAASVSVPSGWASADAAAAGVPDLGARTAVLATAPGLSAYVVIVLAPRGLPAPLRELLGPLRQWRRDTLAGLPARSYPARLVAGDRMAELTVAPTTSGNLAVVCLARSGSWMGAAGCAGQVERSGTGLEPAS